VTSRRHSTRHFSNITLNGIDSELTPFFETNKI
jgi:hypothetical protein